MQAPINIQAIYNNATNADATFRYNANFNVPLLPQQNDYSVAITRLRVPGTKIQSFVIRDQSRYYFTLASTNSSLSNQFQLKTFTEYLPDDSGVSSTDPNEYVGAVQYYNPSQMLDIFTRCMFRNWIGFCNLWQSYVINTGFLTESWRTTQKSAWTRSINVPFIMNTTLANIEFHLQRFITSDNPIGSNNVISPGDYPTRLTLVDPKGAEIILMNVGPKSYVDLNNYDTNRYMRFTEGAYVPTNYYNLGASNKNVITYLPTAESLLKFNGNYYDHITQPNWTLKFDSFEPVYGEIAFRFIFHTLPTDKRLPSEPPTFSLDGSRISLNTSETFINSDIEIGFSPTIKAMIDFGESYHCKLTNGDYNFRFPAYINGSNPLSQQISILQFAPHISSLSNISRLIVASPSLSTQNDYVLSTFAIASTNQLADFTIDLDTDGVSDLVYSTDAGIIPWRRYQLQSGDPLSRLDLECVLEYSNGLTRDLVLPPNTTFICRLSFFSA